MDSVQKMKESAIAVVGWPGANPVFLVEGSFVMTAGRCFRVEDPRASLVSRLERLAIWHVVRALVLRIGQW